LLGGIVYAMGNNASPVIKITNPANNAVYYAPATININAKALDTDGAITKVRFYNGTTLLKSDIKSPYSVSWSNVPAGTYYLKAKATDNFGLSTTSAIVRISVVAKTTIVSSKPGSTDNQPDANGPVRMKLYPNPVSNTLNLSTEGLRENKRSTLVVLSSSGVVIKTMPLNNLNKVVQLDVSTMVSGVYTIKVSSGSKIVVKQFVKL
ncbi:MAG TPA: Ig-like domain-containing protein, partial [Segetibacter sp.]|nr:Ig-like domain-containing protein [Segetibacter sp.]